MSDLSELSFKRDWRTPVPLTGKPVTKTYYDWGRRCYRTDVCILLGARGIAPSVPYRDRRSPFGRHAADDQPASPPAQVATKAPEAPKAKTQRPPLAGGLRDRIRQHLRTHGPSTTAQIVEAIQWTNRQSISAAIHNDPLIKQIGGAKGTGRRDPDRKARWALREWMAAEGSE